MNKTSNAGHSRAPNGDDLMNKEQVAEMLGKSVRTIDNWRRQLELPSYKLENSVYFKRTEVLAFMEQFKDRAG